MSLNIDSHTHAWDNACPLVQQRRYTPSEAHTCEMLLKEMSMSGVNRAVLVQPSFLGTDNSYMLNQLSANPLRFKGVAVVEPDIKPECFADIVHKGVTGVRLNIIGSSVTAQKLCERYASLLELLKEHNCHLEIQTSGDHWQQLLPYLIEKEIDIVVDHFGRPDSVDCSGFKAVVDHMVTERVWVKMSGWYRFKADPSELATILLDTAPQRLVWGSDYPWTQHADGKTYQGCIDLLSQWTNGRYLNDILIENPKKLFKFDNQL